MHIISWDFGLVIFSSWSIPGCVNYHGKPDGSGTDCGLCKDITISDTFLVNSYVFSFKCLSCMYDTCNPWVIILISLRVKQDHFPRYRIQSWNFCKVLIHGKI